jgi:type I restriction enzyme S subunit
MRAMKDSGIEWIGEIPREWELQKIKFSFDIVAGATPKSGEANYWDGDIPWVTPADYTTEDVFVLAGRKSITQEGMDSCATSLVPAGSLVFSKRAPVGLVAISSNPLCTNQGCLSCIPKEKVDAKYYYYVMSIYGEQFNLFASGTTFKEISTDAFANFKLPYPNLKTQRKIAAYLDAKCAEIDALIAAKEKTNALLKERRQSIIYEAVTKGLDPTVPMKDSGVEWIGEIPEGWSVCRIKRVAEIVTGNTPSKASGDLNYSDDGLMWVKPDNLLGNVPVKDTSEHLSDDGCILAKVVPANTPLTCCIGTIGKVGYSEKAVAFNQQINAICFEESVDTRFGLYCLMAQDEQQKCFANGNVLKILNAEAQGRLFIAIPSLSEQRIIAEHLDMQCQMIDENCAANNVTIQKLKEYRQSLIFEAVTGKIEM